MRIHDKILTGQSSNNILNQNYLDKKVTATDASKSGFSVFEFKTNQKKYLKKTFLTWLKKS